MGIKPRFFLFLKRSGSQIIKRVVGRHMGPTLNKIWNLTPWSTTTFIICKFNTSIRWCKRKIHRKVETNFIIILIMLRNDTMKFLLKLMVTEDLMMFHCLLAMLCKNKITIEILFWLNYKIQSIKIIINCLILSCWVY